MYVFPNLKSGHIRLIIIYSETTKLGRNTSQLPVLGILFHMPKRGISMVGKRGDSLEGLQISYVLFSMVFGGKSG